LCITFGFALVDATISFAGNEVIVDSGEPCFALWVRRVSG
jgi:hypothetical protein